MQIRASPMRRSLLHDYYQQAYTSLAPSGVFELARHAAESALKLNSQLGLAHAILGAIYSDYDWDLWAAADREFKQAITLAPHDGRVLTIAADLAVALGQLDAARQMLKQALAYDPLLADAYSTLVWTEWFSGRYTEMLTAARKILEIDPAYDGEPPMSDSRLYIAVILRRRLPRSSATATRFGRRGGWRWPITPWVARRIRTRP